MAINLPPKPPKQPKGGNYFSRPQIREIAAPVVYRHCRDKKPFGSRDIYDECPVINSSGMKDAKAVGDALGDHETGMNLRRVAGGRFALDADNAARAANYLNDEDRATLATEGGFATVADFDAAVNAACGAWLAQQP